MASSQLCPEGLPRILTQGPDLSGRPADGVLGPSLNVHEELTAPRAGKRGQSGWSAQRVQRVSVAGGGPMGRVMGEGWRAGPVEATERLQTAVRVWAPEQWGVMERAYVG